MTEETSPARLDFSNPPPGYLPHPFRPEIWGQSTSGIAAPAAWGGRFTFAFIDATGATVLDSHFAADEAAAISAAWAHYEPHNDPPGMRVIGRGGVAYQWDIHPSIGVYVAGPEVVVRECRTGDLRTAHQQARDEARAGAWAWYKRRHALAARIDAEFSHPADAPGGVWPDILAYTDALVAEIEHIDRTAPENPPAMFTATAGRVAFFADGEDAPCDALLLRIDEHGDFILWANGEPSNGFETLDDVAETYPMVAATLKDWKSRRLVPFAQLFPGQAAPNGWDIYAQDADKASR